MKKIRKLINNNLCTGDIGLGFNVVATTKRNGYYSVTNHICEYKYCKTFTDVIMYYFKHYYKKGDTILSIEHHKISKQTLHFLSMAC